MSPHPFILLILISRSLQTEGLLASPHESLSLFSWLLHQQWRYYQVSLTMIQWYNSPLSLRQVPSFFPYVTFYLLSLFVSSRLSQFLIMIKSPSFLFSPGPSERKIINSMLIGYTAWQFITICVYPYFAPSLYHNSHHSLVPLLFSRLSSPLPSFLMYFFFFFLIM